MGPSAAIAGRSQRAGWIAATFYIAIVLALWTPFNLYSGMPYETGFVYTSEISTWWNGFLFGADWSRIHTSTFFQVPYLLGQLTGFPGSWVPYQMMYAALWWARGFLMFLIVRRLLPGRDGFAYLTGALVLVHSSDLATGWVGQMPQPAYIFWMLAAFYLLLRGLDAISTPRARVEFAGAILCEGMALWTYESPIVLIVAAPLLLWWLRRETFRKHRGWLWGWYVTPVIYLGFAALRYAPRSEFTYQQTVLRKNWAVGSILGDWAFNVGASLRFWAWPGEGTARAASGQLAVFALIAVVVMLAGAVALRGGFAMDPRPLAGALGVGFLAVVLSFPVYLLLDSARSLWRTQILAGVGAALVFSSAIALCACRVRVRWLQLALIANLSGIVCWFGSDSVLKKSAEHRWIWEHHKHAMAEVLAVAPRVKPGTVIVLTNVPKGSEDPFNSANMWFDMALRLAYPGTPVAGSYWHADGEAAAAAGPVHVQASAGSLLIMRYSEHGPATIVEHIPEFLVMNLRGVERYNPFARIVPGPASELAGRRYGVLR